MDLSVVRDPNRPELITLIEERNSEIAVAMVAVIHGTLVGKAAALTDFNRGSAREDHVVSHVGASADHDPSRATNLRAKVPPKLHIRSDDECAAVGHMKTESGTEVDPRAKADPRVRVAE